MKRPLDSTQDDLPRKKRIVAHVQRMPPHTEPAAQVAEFAQGQLLRSITAALTMAGFDSVKPTALEMFRSQVEEYMLRFATEIRLSMQSARRAKPTAQDFAVALGRTPNTRAPSVLQPQIDLVLPEVISYHSISDPEPAPQPAPDLSSLLQPLCQGVVPRNIPSHFPRLPPRHAWISTDVFPSREKDSRKMREKATEEGILAEQALRKLAAAAKAGAFRAESRKRSGTVLAGPGRARASVGRRGPSSEDILGDVLQDIGGLEGGSDHPMGMDGTDERWDKIKALQISEGLLVNHDIGHWRGGKRQGLAL